MKANIGIIGIGAMGKNLCLNIIDKGYVVAAYDISLEQLEILQNQIESEKLNIFTNLANFIDSLKKPRKIIILIKSGKPVDEILGKLTSFLEEGDIIIDGGNSNYKDTERRYDNLQEMSIKYVGMGISGGPKGAREGPSLMPGGDYNAWENLRKILQKIAATTKDGISCCQWIGERGAGHFVKTVHNGIEYSEMQLISETYHVLKQIFQLNNSEISQIFSNWNESKLESYLLNISATILSEKDPQHEKNYLLDAIVDKASQKGTGRWTVHESLENAVPSTLISTAVNQRFISAQKETRTELANQFKRNPPQIQNRLTKDDVMNALYCAKILTYSQGFELLNKKSNNEEWNLSLGQIATIWRAGCIIRSSLLDKIAEVYNDDTNKEKLILRSFNSELQDSIVSLQKVIINTAQHYVPTPGFNSAFNYLLSITSDVLPANLIQAQRDYFGSHGYERYDGTFEHYEWS